MVYSDFHSLYYYQKEPLLLLLLFFLKLFFKRYIVNPRSPLRGWGEVGFGGAKKSRPRKGGLKREG
jgi:hypothetical protein